jgi:uncharacterized protein YyaL (SSP411 family)
MEKNKYTNALASETSPYLLQHAHNPVDWHPWNEQSLAKAKSDDKPILLSVGYSACHWCHVMERESFENEEIARLMNENFINIKVDREERPDIDSIYMTAVQMMTGRGGWPMTVFLTPDQKPFYCGTYFPPEDRHGMPGFKRVLRSIADAFREKRQDIEKDAESVAGELQKSNLPLDKEGELGFATLNRAASSMASTFDSQNGGFGTAPKFPPSMALDFLMRFYWRNQKTVPGYTVPLFPKEGQYNQVQFYPRILDVIELTLNKMAQGGIYDQIGGGFHRYSVDAQWLIPHFEKMLYDNALLSRVYLDAFLLTGKNSYRRISEEILDYVAREMTSPEGGFYSSQDADSEGAEGAFFVWSVDEVESILGDDAELFCRYYGISTEGNFEGKNILSIPREPGLIARMNNVSEDRLREVIQKGKKLLFEARETRVKPGRDEKVLTGWNGLILRSYAEAARSLDRKDYLDLAVGNASFLLANMIQDGRLLRSYKDGRARFNGCLEDYACLVDGLISLYEATFAHRWIQEARALAATMVSKFWDPQSGGFYFTPDDHESLIHRPKEFYDNATPSGNSTAAYALLRLWKLTGEERWADYPNSILQNSAGLISRQPLAFPNMLCAFEFYMSRPKEIAVIGNPADSGAKALLKEIFSTYCPNKVVAGGIDGELPLLKDRSQIDGTAAAYVCRNFTCSLPIRSVEALREELAR